MITAIVSRNITRNLVRNKPVLIILFTFFAFLLAGNGFINFISESFRSLYTQSLTGDLSISAAGDDFTLFGSNALLVGDILSPSPIPRMESVMSVLESNVEVDSWAGVLTLFVQVQANNASAQYIAFGIDFPSYLELLPGIQLHSGSFPAVGNDLPSVMLQPDQHLALGSPELGSIILLTSSNGHNFSIREAVLSGLYTYPAQDSLMSQLFLVDAALARSLIGYVPEQKSLLEVSGEQRSLIESNVNDLFNIVSDVLPLEGNGENLNIEDAERLMEIRRPSPTDETSTNTTWHFILLNTVQGRSLAKTAKDLQQEGLSRNEGYRLLNWRNTAGGNALNAFFLQISMNSGMGIIIFGMSLIIMNSFTLSILERKREIGTMRALGSQKRTIVFLITVEILIIVLLTTSLGTLFGYLLTTFINSLTITTDNRYMNILLGGRALQGLVTIDLILKHIITGTVLALMCVFYPLFKAVNIPPSRAMM